MHPGRSLTIPLGVAGVVSIWVAAIVFRIAASLKEGAPYPSVLDLFAIASTLTSIGVLGGGAWLLKAHRRKVWRMLEDNRDSILQGVSLQLMMRDEIRREATVRRLPSARN